jgi:hypothetical protein
MSVKTDWSRLNFERISVEQNAMAWKNTEEQELRTSRRANRRDKTKGRRWIVGFLAFQIMACERARVVAYVRNIFQCSRLIAVEHCT